MRPKKLTKKYAKKISLEVWGYLKEHPEIKTKSQLPTRLYNKINWTNGDCLLCEICSCFTCPLKGCISSGDFPSWTFARRKNIRRKYAMIIYNKILSWDIKE